VIVACGGVNGGYTLFIADHKLHYDYNFLNSQRYSIVSPVLPTGKVDIKVNFIKTGMLKGTGELYVNGKKVAQGPIDKTVPGSFSLSETFDVGVDNGTPVSSNYKAKDHFPFTGKIDKVTIDILTPVRISRRRSTKPRYWIDDGRPVPQRSDEHAAGADRRVRTGRRAAAPFSEPASEPRLQLADLDQRQLPVQREALQLRRSRHVPVGAHHLAADADRRQLGRAQSSTVASVWPGRSRRPPGRAPSGKTCPGRTKSLARAMGVGEAPYGRRALLRRDAGAAARGEVDRDVHRRALIDRRCPASAGSRAGRVGCRSHGTVGWLQACVKMNAIVAGLRHRRRGDHVALALAVGIVDQRAAARRDLRDHLLDPEATGHDAGPRQRRDRAPEGVGGAATSWRPGQLVEADPTRG